MRRVLVTVLFCAVLAACGPVEPVVVQPLENIELPSEGTFTVTLSGALEAEYAGEASVLKDTSTGYALYLTGERYSANLVLPLDQTVGTFNIQPLMTAFSNAQTVAVPGGVIVDDDVPDGELPFLYDNVSAGRVTLLSIQPMSGAFTFTVTDSDGAEISVYAVFNALPLTEPAPEAP